MEVAACNISRLPDEILVATLSLTTPLDACYAALVSWSFHAAADSDTVWSCFLPNNLPVLASGEIYPTPMSKKEMFVQLSSHPVLLTDQLTNMWLDRRTGAKCYMLSARALNVSWGDTPRYWHWIHLTGCRFAQLLSAALSRSFTTPPEAARAATVSHAFRAAADSDNVWACFLPGDLPPLDDNAPSLSKKEMFLSLCNRPVLLADGLTSMRLDKKTGAKCYMLSARALNIFLDDRPECWRWIPLTDCSSRFSECTELVRVSLLAIEGRISCRMLPMNTNYGAYIVFKMTDESYGLHYPRSPPQYASLHVGERSFSTEREVYLQALPSTLARLIEEPPHRFLPKRRADGWMELEMAAFRVEEGDVGDVLFELRLQRLKRIEGLIVQGIEIRPQVAGEEDWFSYPPSHGFFM